jgi:hypothetical protein
MSGERVGKSMFHLFRKNQNAVHEYFCGFNKLVKKREARAGYACVVRWLSVIGDVI